MGRVMFPQSRPPESLVRMVITQALLGALLGFLFACGLFVFDAQGIGTLIRSSDSGVIAFILLAAGFMVTGGSVVAGTAIMSIGSKDDDDRGGGHFAHDASHDMELRPIPIRVDRSRSRMQNRNH